MRLVEVRDLDGPNLFLMEPAIKLELERPPGATLSDAQRTRIAGRLGVDGIPALVDNALPLIVDALREELWPYHGLGPAVVRQLDDPEHVVIAFPWLWRSSSVSLAEAAVDALLLDDPIDPMPDLRELFGHDRARDDMPEWLRAADARIPIVGITGTNGKTTTTRLLSHIARTSGKHVGWTSTAGVFIDGDLVLEGDYTGPSGARRVLQDDKVELAVLETARGGILLRGMAYECNDVSIFVNVSPDHLDMHGVQTVETLAEVKSLVVRVTRPGGTAVLNADDPLVMRWADTVAAEVLLFSTRASSPIIDAHREQGGRAVIVRDGSLWQCEGDACSEIAALTAVPMTWGGRAAHNVENAAAASGAAWALGFGISAIHDGLATFRSDSASNRGRLNVYRRGDQYTVIDYAHNESGLLALLHFGRGLLSKAGVLGAVIGTAGDRQDTTMRNLGRIAAEHADRIYIKDNPRYLRGRPEGEATNLMLEGAQSVATGHPIFGPLPGELAAFDRALDDLGQQDVIVVMCLEEQTDIVERLRTTGWEEWTGAAADEH